MALKILHTADWHLGRSFPLFAEEDQPKLTRARIEAVDKRSRVGRELRGERRVMRGRPFMSRFPRNLVARVAAAVRAPAVDRPAGVSAARQSRSAVAHLGVGAGSSLPAWPALVGTCGGS